MALKLIGIEDDNTFPGRVGTSLSQLAKDANTDKLTKTDASTTYATKTELDNKMLYISDGSAVPPGTPAGTFIIRPGM